MQAVYPEVQHEAAHQDTPDGPRGCQDTHGPHTQGIKDTIIIIIIFIINNYYCVISLFIISGRGHQPAETAHPQLWRQWAQCDSLENI